MILLASPKVVNGKSINAIAFYDSCWFILNDDDFKEGIDTSIIEYELYSEELLYQRIPFIKGKLNEDEETLIIIDSKYGTINVNPKHKHWGFSTSNKARATNQANFPISLLSYIKTRKIYSGKILAITLSLVLLSMLISWFFIFYLIRFLFLHVFTMLNNRNMYLSGTLNPSIVISINPTRIATLVNLSKFIGKYPLIRVKKVELPSKDRFIGNRIAVAGKYQSSSNSIPYWNFFNPLPLIWGAKNKEEALKKTLEISNYDWITLNKELKAIGNNLIEGYYPIQIKSSQWKDIENPIFVQLNEETKNDL